MLSRLTMWVMSALFGVALVSPSNATLISPNDPTPALLTPGSLYDANPTVTDFVDGSPFSHTYTFDVNPALTAKTFLSIHVPNPTPGGPGVANLTVAWTTAPTVLGSNPLVLTDPF